MRLRSTVLGLLLLAGCGSSQVSGSTGGSATVTTGAAIAVVAVENCWGSLARQLGGERAGVNSIVVDPNADPHDYEPKPNDARMLARARLVIVNGAGYDAWAEKLLAANPTADRVVVNIATVAGKKPGDNPHLWYDPAVVALVVDHLTAAYQQLDPADAAYFDSLRRTYLATDLQPYHAALDAIKQRYHGVPIGVTEDVFTPMAQYLGLDVISPPEFMRAVAEGSEPAATDKARFDQQVAQKQIAVLVWNRQTQTPDTDALVKSAGRQAIPVVPVTETLDPADATFQAWQTSQLRALQQALAQATGR